MAVFKVIHFFRKLKQYNFNHMTEFCISRGSVEIFFRRGGQTRQISSGFQSFHVPKINEIDSFFTELGGFLDHSVLCILYTCTGNHVKDRLVRGLWATIWRHGFRRRLKVATQLLIFDGMAVDNLTKASTRTTTCTLSFGDFSSCRERRLSHNLELLTY